MGDPTSDDSKALRSLERFGWAVFAALGLVVFEITADPTVAAVIFCVKFGVRDVLTGVVLWRVDPLRRRGIICAMLYAAYGGLKTMATGAIAALIVDLTLRLFWP